MAETAAHRVDQVFLRVPVRQWVFSLPKRLRYFLLHDAELVNQVLRIFLEEVEKALLACTHSAAPGACFGAVSFIHPKKSSCCPTQAVSNLWTGTRWGTISITRGPVSRAADAIGGR